MAKIRLNLSRLSVAEKIAKAKQIVAAMTGNPNFTAPSPPLPEVATAATELQTAAGASATAKQTLKETTAVQNDKEATIDQLLTRLAGYVESVAGSDEQVILSAGMDVRAPSVSTTERPPQPQALAATAGDRDGEIDLSWESVSGAKSYAVEQSGDPVTPNSWQHAGVSTRSLHTAAGLTSGTRYWFRVAAINKVGQSGWSDPAMKIAP